MKQKKLRKNRIEEKLTNTVNIIDSISDKIPEDFYSFKKMDLEKDGIYKRIESAIQNLIDICSIINSDLRLGIPEEEDQIINNLEKKNIISKKISGLIKEMKGFRNILVHKYGEISDKKAYESIKQGLQDFELIINEFEKFLIKHN